MKRTAFHIFITIAAVFASAVAMGQVTIHVPDGASLYVSPDAIVSGLPKKDQAIVYVAKDTRFTIAENSIFTGQIRNSTIKTSKSRTVVAKKLPASTKQIIASKATHTQKLASLPLSKQKTAAKVAASCCGASAPSTSFKSSLACLFIVAAHPNRNAASKKILLKACPSAGINTFQLFEDNAHFARPPNAIG